MQQPGRRCSTTHAGSQAQAGREAQAGGGGSASLSRRWPSSSTRLASVPPDTAGSFTDPSPSQSKARLVQRSHSHRLPATVALEG